MPQHIAKPTAPGSFSEWTPVGAATIWQAWANELQDSYVITLLGNSRALVPFEALPAEAVSVSRVSLVALVAGDGVATVRLVLRLAGTDSLGAILTPPEGGYTNARDDFAQAPGALAWTVARRNAIEGGAYSLTAPLGSPLNVDSLRLVTDYETATATQATEAAASPVRVQGSASAAQIQGLAPVARVAGSARIAQVQGSAAVARVVGSARVHPIQGGPRGA